MFLFRRPEMVKPEDALPGRENAINPNPQKHAILGTDVLAEPGENQEVIFLAGGCYWGVEEIYWQMPGVVSTAVGFMGGYTPHPTYREVCTGETGHTETVRVVFDKTTTDVGAILKTFYEMHDPTSLNKQAGDIGTQYRSAVFYTTHEQGHTAVAMRDAYEKVLRAAGKGEIVTEFKSADSAGPFYLAEDDHQQYLHKVPNGYRCHSESGLPCPLPGSGPLAGI